MRTPIVFVKTSHKADSRRAQNRPRPKVMTAPAVVPRRQQARKPWNRPAT